MRFLKIDDRGELSLTHDLHKDLPPYAILSHTWGEDHEEVTLDDLENGSGPTKAGYTKIQFCAAQARADGLQYIWVDTCCIDKRNQSELAEAIVSMFRWYTNAVKCYVFLSDVSARKRDCTGAAQLWESAFRKSRWFLRGWTLQEMLAPRRVEFYSREGERLGDKDTLERVIHEITAIPTAALRDTPLSHFTPDERMRWALNRKTTRSEDRAYSLLGIFDVAMPPIYGEGEQKAFDRLKDEIAKSCRRQLEGIGQNVVSSNSCYSGTQGPGEAIYRRKALMASLGFDQMDSRRSTIKNAYSTTCKWLLKHPAYTAWLDPEQLSEHRGFLWINGKPGAGKSTLIKFAHARAGSEKPDHEILLSFFFNARGGELEKSIVGMYRALLFQLLDRAEDMQELLDDLGQSSNSHSDEHAWTIEELCKLLSAAIRKLGKRRLKCFVDALDECYEQQVQEMITFFEDLGQIAVDNGTELYVCFASRHFPIIDIRNGRQLILEDEVGHAEDLAMFVQRHLRAGNGKFVDEVRMQIRQKANGVFLWAVLVVSILNKEFKSGRVWAVKRRLEEIPPELGDLFKDILRRDCADMDEFLLCLQWILFAKRPLRREEFYYAMMSGLEPDSEEMTVWDPDRITEDYMSRFVLTSSKGFAELTKSKTPTVQFIHESVRDFLIKDKGLCELWPHLGEDLYSLSHDRLKRCCGSYLDVDISSHRTPDQMLDKASSDNAKNLRKSLAAKFPFLEYASQYVLYHGNEAATAIPQDEFLADFVLDTWIQVTNLLARYDTHRHTPNASLLYVLAENNFARLIRTICPSGPAIGVRGERYNYPLFAALVNGHQEAVRALLHLQDADIPIPIEDINTQEFRRAFSAKKVGTPVLWALENGYNTVADILTESADFYAYTGETEQNEVFMMAALRGCEGVVSSLMAADGFKTRRTGEGQDIASQGLVCAASYRKIGVVRILLEKGVNVNATDFIGDTAFISAARSGRDSTVQLLLDQGADTEVTDRFGATALIWAARCGNESTVQILLKNGLDLEAIDEDGKTPLMSAASWGQVSIVQLLLENKATIGAIDNEGKTALHHAVAIYSERNRETVIRLLLENGANIDAIDNKGRTTLHCATASLSSQNRETLIRLMLENGANTNAIDNEGMTALHYAAANLSELYREPIIRLLLENGANTNAINNKGRTALHYAAANVSEPNREPIIRLLLENGANVDAIDNEGKTALHYAVVCLPSPNAETFIQLLLENGASAKATDRDGLTALNLAEKQGRYTLAEILRDFARDQSLLRPSANNDCEAQATTNAVSTTAGFMLVATERAEDPETTYTSPICWVQGVDAHCKKRKGETFALFQDTDCDQVEPSVQFQADKTKAESGTTGFTFEDAIRSEDSGAAISSPGQWMQEIGMDCERGEWLVWFQEADRDQEESFTGFAAEENFDASL